MTLYALLCEGYTSDYHQMYGGDDRFLILKNGIKVFLKDIPSFFKDKEAVWDCSVFRQWKDFGFPRPWSECSAQYVALVQALKEQDDFYHPPMRLA